MSWDLFVYTEKQPSERLLAEMQQAFEAREVSLTISLVANPVPVDGVPAEVQRACTTETVFAIELAAAYDSAEARSVAKTTAQLLADEYDGLVFDPQAAKRAAIVRVDVLSLRWYCAGTAARDLADAVVLASRESMPEALPLRFGTTAPLKRRFSDKSENFSGLWSSQERQPVFGMCSWTATAPVFGGLASFNLSRKVSSDALSCVCISMELNASSVSEELASKIACLFRTVAEQTGAFYAAGHVRRGGVLGRGNSIGFDGASEELSRPSCKFRGIPSAPAWLSWFGPAYARVLDEPLSDLAEHCGECLLLRLGTFPKNRAQLTAVFPELPAAVVEPEDRQLCAEVLPGKPVG